MNAVKMISFLGALALAASPAAFSQTGDDSIRPGLNQETAGTLGTSTSGAAGTGSGDLSSIRTTTPGEDLSSIRSTNQGSEGTGTTLSGASTTGVTGTGVSGTGTSAGTGAGSLGGVGDGSDTASQGAGGTF